ncbi:hypothetical protein XENTR_v10002995 [Xenopus tropicalis]|nr:hypothetical protein XENTR_v10002995 [Xenopus tropicalis]
MYDASQVKQSIEPWVSNFLNKYCHKSDTQGSVTQCRPFSFFPEMYGLRKADILSLSLEYFVKIYQTNV